MTMSMAVVIFLFPLVQHFGEHRKEDDTIGRIIFKSFADWKAMLFYSAAAGIALAYARVPVPKMIGDWYILKGLIFIGSAAAYFGIGMRLHIGHLRPHLRSHLLVGMVKFIATPLLTLGMVLVAQHTGLVQPPPKLLVQTFILMAFMPTAIQSVIVSNLFHLDARMAGSIWVVNTLLFLFLVLPIILIVAPML